MARITVTQRQNFDFKAQLNQFIQYRNGLTRIIGNEAVNFYKKSWSRQGFIENSRVEKWAPRKQGKRRNTRAILVKSGRLRRSVRITRINPLMVSVGSDVPYAKIHNEGGVINKTVRVRGHLRNGKSGRYAVKFHSRKMNLTMPKRKFMGQSQFFDRRIRMQIKYRLNKIFNAR